ncbi:MAG TPA: hypothetical protein VF485_12775 [Sphingomonas sp.]
MNRPSFRASSSAKPPIRAWRIVCGAFLHFAVPAYVVAVVVVTLFNAPAAAPISDLARLALGYSGWFLAGYAALTLAATIAAAAIEPLVAIRRRRRDAIDPSRAAIDSRLRVTHALADARSLPGADLRRLADALAAPRWNHDDERYQALSRDLEQVVHAMTAANRTASDESRPDITALATRSLQRIDDRLGDLAVERSRLDHGDARAVARYVDNRYGSSDFAGS